MIVTISTDVSDALRRSSGEPFIWSPIGIRPICRKEAAGFIVRRKAALFPGTSLTSFAALDLLTRVVFFLFSVLQSQVWWQSTARELFDTSFSFPSAVFLFAERFGRPNLPFRSSLTSAFWCLFSRERSGPSPDRIGSMSVPQTATTRRAAFALNINMRDIAAHTATHGTVNRNTLYLTDRDDNPVTSTPTRNPVPRLQKWKHAQGRLKLHAC